MCPSDLLLGSLADLDLPLSLATSTSPSDDGLVPPGNLLAASAVLALAVVLATGFAREYFCPSPDVALLGAHFAYALSMTILLLGLPSLPASAGSPLSSVSPGADLGRHPALGRGLSIIPGFLDSWGFSAADPLLLPPSSLLEVCPGTLSSVVTPDATARLDGLHPPGFSA